MANKNINDLPTATSLNAGDKLEILQGGTNKQIDASLLGAVQSVTGPQVDDTDPLNPIVEQLGLIQIIDLDGDFFTDLATASAYIRTMWVAPPTITNESFDSGVYYFTVPSNTIIEGFFLTDTVGGLPNNASVIDPLGLLTEFQSGACFVLNTGNHILGNCSFADTDFYQFSGNVFIKNIVDIFTSLGNSFAEFSSGKFIIEGNIGPLETAQYTPFFRNSTSTIFVNAGKYTSNSGTIQGDLQTAITNGCNVQFDGINLATVNDISGLASINSPIFTGTPLAPNAALFDATTQIATTEWVRDNAGGCLYRKSNGTPVTGVTTQQLVDGHLIAGGVMESGWDLLNEIYLNKDLDNGTVTLRVLYNSTNSLSGATTLATYTSTAANNQASFIRNFGVISPTVTELFIHPTTNATGDFIGTSNIPVTQLNIDWTQPIYILWSIQNSSAADTTVISRNKLWKK